MNDLLTLVMTADADKPEQIAQVLRTLRQPTAWDKLKEATIINMLSSPLTWGLTGTSVLSHLVIGSGRILVATPLDALHEALRYGLRGQGRTMFFREAPEALKGVGKMLTTPSSELRQIGLTNPRDIYGQIIRNGFTPDAIQAAVELGDMGAIRREYLSEGKRFGWLGQWMHRISTRPVEAAYASMGHVLYGSMLHSLAYREARRLLNSGEWRTAMHSQVYDTGSRNVSAPPGAKPTAAELRDYILRNQWDFPHVLEQAGAIEDYSLLRSKLPKWYAAISAMRSTAPDASGPRKLGAFLLHRLLPFSVVPMNFIRMGIDTSVLGTAYHASYGYGHAGTREKQAEEFRKVLVGSLLFGAALALLAADNLTGQGPTDPSKRRLWLATHQPDSVRLLGNWVSYDNTYFGIPLAMVANAVEAAQEQIAKTSKSPSGDEVLNIAGAAITGAIKGTGEAIANESFVRTIGDIVKMFTGNSNWGSLLANQVDALVPLASLVALWARMGDGLQRESRTFTENVADRIPGLREQQPTSLNPLGQPQPNDQAGFGGFAGLLPFRPATKPDQNNPVIREYERLDVSLPPAPTSVHSIPLTDEEKHNYEADVGPKIEAAAGKLIASAGYQKLSDVNRAKVLKQIVDKLRTGEDALALKRMGNDEIKRRLQLLKPAA